MPETSPPVPPDAETLDQSSGSVDIDAVVSRFESQWLGGARLPLEQFLPPSPNRLAVLVELVHAELEFRLKTDGSVRVEEYLARFPELAADTIVVAGLVAAEVELRVRRGDPPTPEEVRGRFPELDLATLPTGSDRVQRAIESPLAGADDRVGGDRSTGAALLARGEWAYELRGELGHGGMGVVYAAHDPTFDRPVAVKVMHRGFDAARFVVESKVTARLPHPGIPPVYALGTLPDGRPFLAMKLIEGRTLGHELKASNRGDLPRLLGTFEQICQTVGFAHSKGIIHRDLKPSNVMVGSFGEVLVMDWGLAKDLNQGSGPAEVGDADHSAGTRTGAAETAVGQLVGTPAYMAPEQARGEPVDARADVFALGGILATMLTGKPPFEANTVGDTVRKAAGANLDDCFAALDVCEADPELVAVAKGCLAAHAGDRYANGAAVAAAVATYRAGVEERLRAAERDRAGAEAKAAEERNTRREAEARVQAERAKGEEQRKRWRVQLLLTVAVFLLVAGVGGFAWYSDHQATKLQLAEERDAGERMRIETEGTAERVRIEAKAQSEQARLAGERDAEMRNKKNQALQGIDSGLKLAKDLRAQYKFQAAGAALSQAADLAVGGAPDRLPEVEQARRDLAFVVKLDDIRFRKWSWIEVEGGSGEVNTKIAAPEYQRAFAERGLDLTTLDPAEAVKLIAESTVKADLVAAVDDWALYEPDPVLQNRLLEVARRADPDPWSARLRDPVVRTDAASLEKLVADVDTAHTSSAAMSVLVELMIRRKLNPVPLLSVARTKFPTDFELAFALGQWHMSNRRDDQQIGPFEAALAIRPDSYVVWINLGRVLKDKGDLNASIVAHEKAVELEPKFAQARSNLSIALYANGDLVRATAECKEAIRIDRTFAEPHILLGILLKDKGDLKDAITEFKEAVRLDPKLALAHSNLGAVLQLDDDIDGAITECKEAIRLDPKLALAHSNLGLALKGKGDLVGAIAEYKEAIRLDPKFTDAHNKLGAALHAKGDLVGAIAEFKEAIRLDPKLAIAHSSYGVALKDKGDLVGAIAEYKEAIRLDPKLAIAHNNYGVALKDKGDLVGAIAEYREAIRLDPKLAMAHSNLGAALKAKDDLDGAIAEYKEALRLEPNYPEAHNNLGNALLNKGDLEGAIAEYKEAIRLAPKLAAAHVNLGAVYFGQKKYAEAIVCARAAVEADPKFSMAHAMLGDLLFQTGDIPGARVALTEAARLDSRWVTKLSKLPPVAVAPLPREVK